MGFHTLYATVWKDYTGWSNRAMLQTSPRPAGVLLLNPKQAKQQFRGISINIKNPQAIHFYVMTKPRQASKIGRKSSFSTSCEQTDLLSTTTELYHSLVSGMRSKPIGARRVGWRSINQWWTVPRKWEMEMGADRIEVATDRDRRILA